MDGDGIGTRAGDDSWVGVLYANLTSGGVGVDVDGITRGTFKI